MSKERVLDIKDLTLGFKGSNGVQDKIIYSGINAFGDSGEIIGLIGGNGRGKSTLLRSISSLIPLYKGDIFLKGESLKRVSRKKRVSEISFVPSSIPRTSKLSLFDMVAINSYHRSNWLGNLTTQERERVEEAICKVGLKDFITSDSSRLSDGEYQRATIAGALVKNSDIILLDEPTSFLDISNKYIITDLLKQIAHNQNKTILFSSHDLQLTLQFCDRIWIMGFDSFYNDSPKGHIEKGTLDKIFESGSLRFNSTTLSFEKISPLDHDLSSDSL